VILTVFDSVFTSLRNIWALAGIRAHHAKTLEQADFLLLATGATVLLSDIATADCSWRSAVRMARDQYPLVIALVMADPSDEPFLEDAPRLGVCGIIWKPIQFDLATKLTRTAHQASLDRRFFRESASKRPTEPQAA
jgi:DNA-binding NarL/FixJ family response regulator